MKLVCSFCPTSVQLADLLVINILDVLTMNKKKVSKEFAYVNPQKCIRPEARAGRTTPNQYLCNPEGVKKKSKKRANKKRKERKKKNCAGVDFLRGSLFCCVCAICKAPDSSKLCYTTHSQSVQLLVTVLSPFRYDGEI